MSLRIYFTNVSTSLVIYFSFKSMVNTQFTISRVKNLIHSLWHKTLLFHWERRSHYRKIRVSTLSKILISHTHKKSTVQLNPVVKTFRKKLQSDSNILATHSPCLLALSQHIFFFGKSWSDDLSQPVPLCFYTLKRRTVMCTWSRIHWQ